MTAVVTRDPTAAERQRRYRARKRALATVTQRDVTPVTAEVSQPATPGVTILPPRRPWAATVLVCIAVTIAVLALVINAQAGWRYGTTPLAAVTFAGLALAADLLAIVLPATAVTLWHAERGWLAVSAWTTWVVAASLAALATLGFVELNTADTAAARGAAVATSTTLAEQRSTAISAAQVTLTAATKQREAECQRRGPLCREREADERAAMVRLNTAIAAPVPTVAAIAAPDPQVAAVVRLTTWAGVGLSPVDVANLRLLLMAALPNIAGLVLCFGLALGAPLRRLPA